MIVVDSSVLISFIRGDDTPGALRLKSSISPDEVLVGDIVLMEVLRGARSDAHASAIERRLLAFEIAEMFNASLARRAAAHYRQLRSMGLTVCKAADLMIGTYCIEHGFALLHEDRDFDPMAEHLGLKLA